MLGLVIYFMSIKARARTRIYFKARPSVLQGGRGGQDHLPDPVEDEELKDLPGPTRSRPISARSRPRTSGTTRSRTTASRLRPRTSRTMRSRLTSPRPRQDWGQEAREGEWKTIVGTGKPEMFNYHRPVKMLLLPTSTVGVYLTRPDAAKF